MKVSIMGAGFVGESLGRALIKAGHTVMLSSRTPNSPKMQTLVDELGERANVGTIQETLAFSDVVAIALRWEAVPDVAAHAGDWSGKIVLDMTQGESAQLAALTSPRVVKIFNTIGAEHYQDPIFSGEAATMLYCGGDTEAKAIAAQLAIDIGFDPLDIGGLSMDRHLVNLAFVWITMMQQGMGRDFAFRIITK